jgi:hypothetical protein
MSLSRVKNVVVGRELPKPCVPETISPHTQQTISARTSHVRA